MVDQALGIALLEPLGGEGRSGALAQQPLEPAPVIRFDAHGRVQGESAAMDRTSWSGSGSNTPSMTQTWKCVCRLSEEPKRWMKATAPARAFGPAPGLCARR